MIYVVKKTTTITVDATSAFEAVEMATSRNGIVDELPPDYEIAYCDPVTEEYKIEYQT